MTRNAVFHPCQQLPVVPSAISTYPLVQGKRVRSFLFPIDIIHAIMRVVRLDGPVNGRSGVCRDLNVDIARMGHLGVSCIIWQV